MSSSRRKMLPLVVLGLGAAIITFFLLTYNPAPVIPRDRDHNGSPVPDGCLKCHGAGGRSPRPENHPINEKCLSCHRWAP